MTTKLTQIELTDDGFRLIEDGLDSESIDWLHLKQIVAYRKDPEGADLLCLGFRKSHEKQYIEVNEEMDGYRELLEAMCDKFPSIHRNWWQKVTGAMGVNYQTIYGIGLGEQTASKAAEKYLNSIENRKKRRSSRKKTAIVIISLIAAVIIIYLIFR